jgi:hypothetical protein
MDSDEDKLYMKLVAFDEIYNFVVQILFIWNHLRAQKIRVPRWLQINKIWTFLSQDDLKKDTIFWKQTHPNLYGPRRWYASFTKFWNDSVFFENKKINKSFLLSDKW